MSHIEYVELARSGSERGEVVLRQRRDADTPEGAPAALELRVNGVFVMDTLETTSETALAMAALEHASSPTSVLIGGLGLGFTVREVLADRRVQHVVVAEIEGALVQWFRDGTIPHGQLVLADGRLSIAVADVQQVVEESADDCFDLVLLDVDNGPDFLVFDGNAGIYESRFLQQVRRTLRGGGMLAVWSSTECERLAASMTEVFGGCTTKSYPVVLQGREDEFWLHLARRLPANG